MTSWYLLAVCTVAAVPPTFEVDVAPVLTRAGCNAAACHGAAAGRGGFKLSLFGGDLDADYDAIVRQYEGRRVRFLEPAFSLFLTKPTGFEEHGGGVRIDADGPEAARIAAWIEHGAPRDPHRRFVRLVVEPETYQLDRSSGTVPLQVWALLEDHRTGTIERRDVTPQCLFTSSDDEAVRVDERGVAEVRRGGRHVIIVRFLNLSATATVISPMRDAYAATPREGERPPRPADPDDWIEQQILSTLDALRLPASGRADDGQLLRRLTLDLAGRLPEPDEVAAYAADTAADKFERRVEGLLSADTFDDYWSFLLGEWLRNRPPGGDVEASRAWQEWLRTQLRQRVGMDRVIRELIVAEGDSHVHGPATFYRLAGDARGQAEYVSETLMGVRLRCANCHNHPLDHWTQDDYHGLAALFADLETGRIVRATGRGQVIHPVTGRPARPRIPGTRFLPASTSLTSARREFAEWLVARDNPYFARAFVNRVWKQLMGRGLMEPVDDVRETNPATHPELLRRLVEDFAAHDFDLRHLVRRIVLSSAYQRESRPLQENAADDRFYSHFLPHRLSAEVLADAIDGVTGIPSSYEGAAEGVRAIALDNPLAPSAALDALGRCTRADACQGSEDGGPGLASRLFLINGAWLNRKIQDPKGRLAVALQGNETDESIVRSFYLRALAREPTAEELAYWLRESAAGDRRQVLEDFLWSLLNCQEFVTNH